MAHEHEERRGPLHSLRAGQMSAATAQQVKVVYFLRADVVSRRRFRLATRHSSGSPPDHAARTPT
ncbi:MAG TPA: hypothetical protein VII19_11510 [Acidimicrobiales bacterium]